MKEREGGGVFIYEGSNDCKFDFGSQRMKLAFHWKEMGCVSTKWLAAFRPKWAKRGNQGCVQEEMQKGCVSQKDKSHDDLMEVIAAH